MKKRLFLLIVLLITSTFILFAQNINNEDVNWRSHSPSQEEIEWAKSIGKTIKLDTTHRISGELRPIAEFEPAEAVLITYNQYYNQSNSTTGFGIPLSLIEAMSKDVKIITVVPETQLTTLQNIYNNSQVNISNCEYLFANTNSFWTRDYGPWFMAVDNQKVKMFDFLYNRPRPSDKLVNEYLANYLSMDIYTSPLQLTGGNFMNDGIKQAASSTLTISENSGLTLQEINDHFNNYLGIQQFHFIPDAIYPHDPIQHIDCWAKLLSPNKVLVDSVAPGANNYSKFEYAANYFRSLTSSWGMPYQVYRVYAPGATSTSPKTPYSNSLILNDKVYVPIGGNSYDAAAIQAYEKAMPGYTIVPVAQSPTEPWLNTDALHCRTHEIADRCMLYIKHQPLFADTENIGFVNFNAELYSYCNNTIYPDSVFVYVKVDGGAYTAFNMQNTEGNTWKTTVYGLQSGTVEYYISAADESGRKECHPYIGAPDPHKFNLLGETPDVPLLVLEKTNSTVYSDSLDIVEDFIKVSNEGNAELTFEIKDIDFLNILSITPLIGTIPAKNSQIIKLSYNFDNVPNGEYEGRFILSSNDPQHPETEISLRAIRSLPVLSLSKTTSTVSTEIIDVVEDFITISNLGDANLTFNIPVPTMETIVSISPKDGDVAAGDSLIITLTYDFRLIAKGEVFTGSFTLFCNDPFRQSVEITYHVTLNVGVDEEKLSLIHIYPNPTFDKIIIHFSDNNSTKAYIYNILGKQQKAFTLKNGANAVDIQEFSSGVYFIKIEDRVFKLVKW